VDIIKHGAQRVRFGGTWIQETKNKIMKDETPKPVTPMSENEMIARFMGLQVYQTYADMRVVPLEDLKQWVLPEQCEYETSFGWLMPVVEKLNGLGLYLSIGIDQTYVNVHLSRSTDFVQMEYREGELLQTLYKGVVIAIKYLNENKY
jgi:hypothetical protein